MEYDPRENLGEGYGVWFFPLVEITTATLITKINYPFSYTKSLYLNSVPSVVAMVPDTQES